MGTIIISTNTTLDGVVQDPDGGQGYDRGGWFAPAGSGDREAWATVEADEAMRAAALLLGRQSYEWFATRWAERKGAWADRLRALPKYVVSSTLPDEAATWGPTTLLRGAVADAVAALKQEQDGEIIVYASYQLGQALLRVDLVDELRIFLHPVVLGDGQRLFGPTTGPVPLRLAGATTIGDGLPLLTYKVVRAT